MRKWIHRLRHSASNIFMSRPLQSFGGRYLANVVRQLRKDTGTTSTYSADLGSANAHQSNKSNQLDEACARARSGRCGHTTCSNRTTSIHATYTATLRSEGQGSGSWLRVSNEPRQFIKPNNYPDDPIERCTGIPTGVTI